MASMDLHPKGQLAHTRFRPNDSGSDKITETTSQSIDAIEKNEDFTAYVIDPIEEKRLLRKLDWSLLPMFTATCEIS